MQVMRSTASVLFDFEIVKQQQREKVTRFMATKDRSNYAVQTLWVARKYFKTIANHKKRPVFIDAGMSFDSSSCSAPVAVAVVVAVHSAQHFPEHVLTLTQQRDLQTAPDAPPLHSMK
jgi:hypothetical protein